MEKSTGYVLSDATASSHLFAREAARVWNLPVQVLVCDGLTGWEHIPRISSTSLVEEYPKKVCCVHIRKVYVSLLMKCATFFTVTADKKTPNNDTLFAEVYI